MSRSPSTARFAALASLSIMLGAFAGCGDLPDDGENVGEAEQAAGVRLKGRPVKDKEPKSSPPKLDDPCNATIVTVDPDNPSETSSITINDFCKMIEASGKSVTVINTQCYGGAAVECCGSDGGGAAPGGQGCHHAAGHSGERTAYGEYDMAAAGAMQPGASGASIHSAGAAQTTSSTPESSCAGQTATVGANDTVITFAGDPLPAANGNPSDHDIGQQVSGANANTVNLEGDGSAKGVEGPATGEALEDAIKNAASGSVWILMLDHGNAGGKSETATTSAGTSAAPTLSFDSFLLEHMAADYGTSGWIVMQSATFFPALTEVTFANATYEVTADDAWVVELGGQFFFRYLLAVPEQDVGSSNDVVVTNVTGPETTFEIFMDTGPIAKLGADLSAMSIETIVE